MTFSAAKLNISARMLCLSKGMTVLPSAFLPPRPEGSILFNHFFNINTLTRKAASPRATVFRRHQTAIMQDTEKIHTKGVETTPSDLPHLYMRKCVIIADCLSKKSDPAVTGRVWNSICHSPSERLFLYNRKCKNKITIVPMYFKLKAT